ncbi:hypothetical protein FS842_009243 [Serendipita sp. 407]|nr:hypothetical protein FS842_009243 [Serendipita sp. 407]
METGCNQTESCKQRNKRDTTERGDEEENAGEIREEEEQRRERGGAIYRYDGGWSTERQSECMFLVFESANSDGGRPIHRKAHNHRRRRIEGSSHRGCRSTGSPRSIREL